MEQDFILKGERIGLREMTEADQSVFWQWLSGDAELRSLVDQQTIPTIEDQLAWFVRCQEQDRKIFSIVRLEDDLLLGNGGLADIDPAKKSAQFRITLGNRDAWGKGYGTEATTLILQFGFTTLGLEQVTLNVLPHNERARNMYEKIGFREVSTDPVSGKIQMVMDAVSLQRTPSP